jgi:hypothetical protein
MDFFVGIGSGDDIEGERRERESLPHKEISIMGEIGFIGLGIMGAPTTAAPGIIPPWCAPWK